MVCPVQSWFYRIFWTHGAAIFANFFDCIHISALTVTLFLSIKIYRIHVKKFANYFSFEKSHKTRIFLGIPWFINFFLGIIKVFTLMPQSPCQLVHHFLENHAVYVLPQHIKQKPVTHLAFLDQGVDHLPLDESKSDIKKVGSHSGRQNYHWKIKVDYFFDLQFMKNPNTSRHAWGLIFLAPDRNNRNDSRR